MTTTSSAAAVPTVNPQTGSEQFSFLARPMQSQYLEAFSDSLFTPGVSGMGMGMPMMGMGMPMMGMPMMGGYGFNNQEYLNQYIQNMNTMTNAQYDLATNASNRQTQFAFDQRGNQNVLGSAAVSLRNDLTRLQAYIKNNDMRQACDLYSKILRDMNASVGEEYDANGNRIGNKMDALRDQIEAYYAQVTGSSLAADINENGSGSFVTMLKSFFGSKQPSGKEALSYMTGDAQQYDIFEKLWRSLTVDCHKSELTQTTTY